MSNLNAVRFTRSGALVLPMLLAACGATTAVQNAQQGAAVSPPEPASAADRIYTGGPIVTVNDAQPTAEAVAVKDGKILAVGTRATVDAHRGPRTVVQDLGGRTLVPGFIDGHGHLEGVGIQAVAANLLPPPDGPNDSIDALIQTTREWLKTSTLPQRYNLILGFGYDDSQLKEQRHPTRDDLDRISTTLPVCFFHQSGHLGAVNSKALEVLGFDAKTQDPPGGHLRRRAGSNEPNGVLEETAAFAALGKLLFGQMKEGEAAGLIAAGQELYLKYGFTTAQSGATDPNNVFGYMKAAREGTLKLDVVSYPTYVSIGSNTFMTSEFASRQYTGHFRIGGIKVTLDGSPQGKTAWLTRPYFVPPEGQKPGYAGYPAFEDEQVESFIEAAYRNGWQFLGHTNGDAALDQLLRSVEKVSQRVPGEDRRTVAIHAQTARADQLDTMKKLGVIPSFFTMHTYYWGDFHSDSVLGPERAPNISPTGWALERGMVFTSHHDAPVAFPDSIRILDSTVNRTTRSGRVLGPHQRVEPIVALKALTLWGAYQHFEEASKGSIEPGKRADFVVLSDNPITMDRSKLMSLQVLETIKEGVNVYRLEPSRAVSKACAESAACFNRMTAALATTHLAAAVHAH